MFFQASVGVAVESNRISLAYLKRSFNKISLAGHAIYPLIKEDPEERSAEIRNRVHEFLGRYSIRSADIFLGIQRDMAILQYIELPAAVKENLKGTLTYEMEKYIPLPVHDIYFDCQIVAENKEANTIKVLLIGVKKEWIDPYLNRDNQLGSGISGIEINSTALVNYFSYKPNANPPNADIYAILCLERGHLELSLVQKRLLNYSRHVKMDHKRDNPQGPALEELELLSKTLGAEQKPLEVVWCGPDPDSMAEALKAVQGIDLHHVKLTGTGVPSDVLASAYGLALKGIQKVPMDINLLPASLRKKVSNAGYYAMFVLSGLLILSVLAWGGSNLLHHQRVTDKLDREIKQLRTEVEGINQTQSKINELEAKIDAINTLRQRHIPVLGIMLDMTKAIPEGAWIERLALADKGGDIEGYADSASALIPLLAASPLLKDVAFLSPITKGKDGKEKFRIGFKVR